MNPVPSRSERNGQGTLSTPVAAELLRTGSQSANTAPGASNDSDEGQISVFWRVFGGTVLSICALVIITVYQQFSGNFSDLRNDLRALETDLRKDLSRHTEVQAEFVKKEEVDSKLRSVWEGIKELREDRQDLQQLKQRCMLLYDLFKVGEIERRQVAQDLQSLNEARAAAEEGQSLARQLRDLREQVARMEGANGGKPTPNVR